MQLGQTFTAHATGGDRIPQKTPGGKSFYEVLPELQAHFKPQEHSEYYTGKNKQGKETFYCYIKWQFIRKRLDDVVGVGGWILERTGMFIDESGNPCLVGRLNILGVVKEGMGIGKAHEKWQGTKIENAAADLLKNCAEEFGIGRYLDDQKGTIQHIWNNAGTDEYFRSMARKLAVQHNLQLKEAMAENNAIADNKPLPKPQPKKENTNILDVEISRSSVVKGDEAEELYPQHNGFFNTFAREFHFPGIFDYARDAITANWKGKTRPGHLDQDSLQGIMEIIACEWGVASGHFEKLEFAESSFKGRMSVFRASREQYTLGEWRDAAIAWRNSQLVGKKEPVKV